MPVSFLNRPEDIYKTLLEAKRFEAEQEAARDAKVQKTSESIAGLAQAYQDYQGRKRDREAFDSIVSPLQQARQGAGGSQIDMPVDPGSGINFLDPQQLAAQNAGRVLPGQNLSTSPQADGMLSRLRNHFNSGQPLSAVERAILEQQIKNQYGDPYGVEKAKAELYRKQAKVYDGTSSNLPPGYIMVGGKVKVDKDYVSPKSEMRKLDIAELKKMQEGLPKLDTANSALDQLESIYYKGFSPDKNPLIARVTGFGDSAAANVGINPSGNRYLQNRKAFAGLIAKGGFGETGVLTQQDIDRVVNVLPNEYATEKEAKLAFDEVRKILKGARARYETKKASVFKGQSSQESNPDFDPLGLRN